jgi:hypothetical protein
MRYTLIRIACAAMLLTIWQPGAARASDFDKLTYFTFSGAVQIPGKTLQPGTYAFVIANPNTSQTVLRVTSADGRKSHGQFYMSRELVRQDATSRPVIVFRETPAGTTPAVRGWFFPAERTGYEFVYSKHQRRALSAGAPSTAHTD